MFEFLNVILTNVAKWYKSADNNKHRHLGFALSVLVSVLWMWYFARSHQYWLASNSATTVLLSFRGIYNNRKGLS